MADRMDKLEAAVRKLAADVSELREEQHERFDAVNERFDAVNDDFEVAHAGLAGIQRTQKALTAAMTQAIKQLGVGKSLEVRVKRLEDAVFGSKH